MSEAKKGNEVEVWLREHGDYLYRYALFRLSDADTARDLVQDTLIAAWKGRGEFRGESAARTWLTGILKHKIIDYIRREVRERRFIDDVESDPTSSWFSADGSWIEAPRAWKDNPEGLAEDEQFRMVLLDCIDRLPAKQRTVFSMRELAGDDTGTVCNEAEITPTNLHVMMHRARLALRNCLDINWFGGAKAR